MIPSGIQWTKEQTAYYNDLYAKMKQQREEARAWLDREIQKGSTMGYLYTVQKFHWGQMALFVPEHDRKRDVCALHIPLFNYEMRAHFLLPRELDMLGDMAGKFGDAFGYRLKSDTIWSDRTTYLWYVVKPKFDPTRSGVR